MQQRTSPGPSVERTGATLTSSAANQVARFGEKRRDFVVARKLWEAAYHMTTNTSARLVRNGAKCDETDNRLIK